IVKKLIGVSDEAVAGIFGINRAFHKDFMCRIHERRHWEYEPALRELRLNGRRAAYFFGYIAYQVGNGTIKNLIKIISETENLSGFNKSGAYVVRVCIAYENNNPVIFPHFTGPVIGDADFKCPVGAGGVSHNFI